jgi:prepilin-type processing-associated H-X9-DG protein
MLLAMGLPAAPAWSDAPLSDRMPADTIAYIGWSGRSVAFDGSLMGQFLQEPIVGRSIALLHDAIARREEPAADGKAFKAVWEMLKIAWQRKVAVGLRGIELTPDMPEPWVDGIVLVDLGDQQAAFGKQLDAALAAVPDDAKSDGRNETLGAYRLIRTDGKDRSLALGLTADGLFWLACTPEGVAALEEAASGASLAASKGFSRAMKAVSGDNEQMAFAFNLPLLAEALRPLARLDDELPPWPVLKQITDAAGLAKATTYVGTTRIVDRNMYTKAILATPAPHRGVLAMFAGKPLKLSDLHPVPADSVYVSAMTCSPSDLLAQARRAQTVMGLGDGGPVDQVLALADAMAGVSVEKDLLASMGETWVLSSAASQGGFLSGTVLSVTLRDEEAFTAARRTVEGRIDAQLKEAGENWSASPLAGSMAGMSPFPRLRTDDAGRAKITYVAWSGGLPIPVAPAWATYRGRLYVALWPQVLRTVIDRNGVPSLVDREEFGKLRARVSEKASVIAYVDSPQLMRAFYGAGLLGWTALANFGGARFGDAIRPDWLPPMTRMEKYTRPSISAISSDAEGIVFEDYGPMIGSTSSFDLMFSPAMQGILLPALAEARRNAKKTISASRLRDIAMASMLYASEHNDKMPPSPEDLVKSGYCSPEQFRSALNDRPIVWKHGRLSRPADFVLMNLPRMDSIPRAESIILAYERPEFYDGEGTNVAFVDGSVTWMAMKDFQAALKRTKQFMANPGAKPAGDL